MATSSDDEQEVTFEGIHCQRCQLELDEPFVCGLPECLQILCTVCRATHEHAEFVVGETDAFPFMRPVIEKYRKSIKECVTKVMGRRAKSEYETMTRLDRSAEVKRQIQGWCAKMHKIVDQAQSSLVRTIETMEEEFKTEADTITRDLQQLERDYKNVYELRVAFNSNKCSPRQTFKLFALVRKYEDCLADPTKTSERNRWEQTTLAFIPNEDALTSMTSTAYLCGKISSNIQLSVDTVEDKRACGIGGMSLMGERLVITDKYNHNIKLFTLPLHCGLAGEAVHTKVISELTFKGQNVPIVAPDDIIYDPDSNFLLATDEQEGHVFAFDPESGKMEWRLEVKRPSSLALTDKLIVVSSEYEKTVDTFKRSNLKKQNSTVLNEHTLSMAANNGVIALCTIRGKLIFLNGDLKQQTSLEGRIDGQIFRPQRVCSKSDRFLACDTHRVIEIDCYGLVKRIVIDVHTSSVSIPGLPTSLAADKGGNVFMSFGNYVKVFPVPLTISPPEWPADDRSESDQTPGDVRSYDVIGAEETIDV